MPKQARPARPQSGLDFQIHYHNVEAAYLAHYAKIQKYEQGKIGLQFFDMWC